MTNGTVPPVPPAPPRPQGPPRPNPPQKQGLPPLAWVGIGCGGILLLGLLVSTIAGIFVANKVREFAGDMEDNPAATLARVIAAANPDIEIVEEDEDAGTITFRELSSGEEVTFSYEDIEDGRLSFETDEGKASFDLDVDGGKDGEARMTLETDEGTTTYRAGTDIGNMPAWVPIYPGTDPEGGFTTDTPEVQGGTYTAKTSDTAEEVLDFFESEFPSEGLAIQSRTTMGEGAMLVAGSEDQRRTASLIVAARGGTTEIVVQYADKR